MPVRSIRFRPTPVCAPRTATTALSAEPATVARARCTTWSRRHGRSWATDDAVPGTRSDAAGPWHERGRVGASTSLANASAKDQP